MTTQSRVLSTSLLALAILSVPAAAQNPAVAPSVEVPVSAYLDSAAAARALAAIPAPELPAGIAPLFSLVFDSAGGVDVAEGVYAQLPAAFAGPVATILRAHARRQAPSGDPDVAYLRVVAGPGAAISLAEVKRTGPEWLDRSFATDLMKPVMLRREEAASEILTLNVAARVLADGTVDPASVKLQGSTGDAEVDRAAFATVHQLRFRPGTVDGIPAPVRVVVPFQLSGGTLGPHSEYQALPAETVSSAVPLSALVDTAALAGELAALPAPADPERAKFRVRLDTTGAVAGVEAIHPGLPEDGARALAEAIRRHVRRQPISPEPLHLHLRVAPGPGARVERSGTFVERATITNQEPVRRLIREAPVRETADVQFAVTADGALDPSTFQFVGSAPSTEAAAAALRIVGQMRFRRGAVDRAPASTWLRVFLWLGRPSEF